MKSFFHFTKKNKLVTLAVFVFLAIETFEITYWRNDYPFTRWGMYCMFPSYSPFIDIEVRVVDTNRPKERIVKDPWQLRRRLWMKLNIGTPETPMENRNIFDDEKSVRSLAAENQDVLRRVIEENIWSPADADNIRVYFVGWKALSHSNIRSPDVREQIFPLAGSRP